MTMHEGQLAVTAEQVRSLVAGQFPRWASLEVRPVASAGTVNALFRLGTSLVARFPLLGDDPEAVRRSLELEAARAAELAGRTSVPTPEPVALGDPGNGYPLPWSVQTWLPGVDGFAVDLSASDAFADDVAGFVAELRALPTGGRSFSGDGRGGRLPDHDGWVATCLARSGGLLNVAQAGRLWDDLRMLPSAGPDVMSHTDLIPGNVLVSEGRLSGVLDVGGFGPADPALDLVAGWHLFDAGPRAVFRQRLGCTELEWQRGRAWALQQGLGAGWYYRRTNPAMSRMGVRTVERLLAET